MLRKLTNRLMRTTAISLLPIAAMAPVAAFAQGDASGVVTCSYGGDVRTIHVVETNTTGGCEVRYDKGAGEEVLWSAANTAGYCLDKASGLKDKLANAGFSCSAGAATEAAFTPAAAEAPAAAKPAATSVVAAAAASSAQTSTAGDDDQDEGFSFDIAEEEAAEPKPVYVNNIEIGVGWVSDDSAKFGEYSGLNTQGAFIVGNFNLQIRDPYDGDSTEYFIARGTNLGLESRSLYAEYGKQGEFRIFGFFDSVPKFLHDDAMTPYIFNDGGTRLTLPLGWVPSNRDNSGLTALNSSLQDVNVSHQREKAGGGVSWLPGKNWTAQSSYYHETKQGTRTIAAIFGTNGGDPAGAIVPEPVDYETDNFDASIGYNGKRGQFAISYNLSLFHDNNNALVFQNPYASSRWAAAASFPDGFGQLALPPDNEAHRVTLAGKYLLTPKIRATGQFNYSHMTQNDPFLPFTVNPALIVTTPLPRSSLQGEINTITANLGVSAQMTPKLTFRTKYRYENRDNNTPQDVFIGMHGDTVDQDTIDSSSARINRPYGRKQHVAKAEADYRLTSKSKLSFGYEYEQLERDFTEVVKTREHKLTGKFSTYPTMRTSGWVGIEYDMRNGSEYVGNRPFLVSATPEHIAEELEGGGTTDDLFENHPFLRKYYIADRDRLKVQGAANWTPHDDLNIAVFGRYNNDDYDKSILGLNESSMLTFTGDVSYQPSKMLNYRLFYTYQNNGYDQTGLAHNSRTAPTDLFDLDLLGWTADTDDVIHTVGAGFDWTAVEGKLDVSVDYYYSNATTEIDFTGGTNLSFSPISNLDTQLHSVEAVAEYQFSENLWFKARYMFSDYNVADFALDGINPDSMNFVIGLGNQAPNFSVHVIGFSAVYKF